MKGSTGFAPLKALDEDGLAEGRKRFRFIPLHKRLDSASARPAALPHVDFGLNLEGVSPDDTNFSHFSTTLSSQSDDNITATFVQYAHIVRPLSLSLPLLFRNRAKIIDASLAALERSSLKAGEGTGSISLCVTALAKDLGSSNFQPFFSSIIVSTARALNPQRITDVPTQQSAYSNDKGVNDDETKDMDDVILSTEDSARNFNDTMDNSTFWQPDVMLVPLFSMINEVSKVLLSHLVAHPRTTVKNLSPLLSHPHYRVREMTAEASLGYIIRKTRDTTARHALVNCMMKNRLTTSRADANQQEIKNGVDGLGVSLFESVRLPSGRLHSRAQDVLQVAMRTLTEQQVADEDKELSDSANDYRINPRLDVIARCFASLCRHISVDSDVRVVGSLLLAECENSVSNGEWTQPANVLFILKKWIQFGGRGLISLLGIPFCQRILNFAVLAVEKKSNNVRLVCESLGAAGSLYRHAPDAFKEKSISRAFALALEKLAKGSNADALLVGLRVVLDDTQFELSGASLRTLTKGMAAVCDRLASLKTEVASVPTAFLALQAALQFLRLASERSMRVNLVRAGFHAPLLQTEVTAVLDRDYHALGRTKNGEGEISLSQALEFISVVPVAKCEEKLVRLVEGCSSWNLRDCANFLSACAYQQEVNGVEGCDSGEKMKRCSQLVLHGRLLRYMDAWRDSSVCSAVVRCVRAFGADIINHTGAKISNGSDSKLVSVTDLVEHVTTNLSRNDGKLRTASVSLLALLDGSTPAESGINDAEFGEDEHGGGDVDVQLHVRRLRESLLADSLSLRGICGSFMFVMRVSRSLGGIGSRCLLVQEMSRLVGQVKEVREDVLFLLVHFALGLFHISLKPLWQNAGDLIRALAGRKTGFVLPIILETLHRCEHSLLGKDDVIDEDAEEMDEIEAGDSENEDEDGNDGNVDDKGSADADDDDGSDGETVKVKVKSSQLQSSASNGHVAAADDIGSDVKENLDSRKRRRSSSSLPISKRQKQRVIETAQLHWNPSEWQNFLVQELPSLPALTSSTRNSVGMLDHSTDALTVVSEIISAIAKEPKLTLKFRSDFINLYFNLSPALFSRNKGNHLALGFSVLLEKMGGLKSCEADKSLESRMRKRLLSDICRSAPPLQSAALRCLCVSRSTHVKQHRDSFLRLIDDGSFREELTLITESEFLEWNVSEDTSLSEGDEAIMDVVLRICFSKMIGKKALVNARKSAVLSFVTSKLPWRISLPKMTELILEPVRECVEELETNADEDLVPVGDMPVNYVQQGLLNSVEMLVKYCRHTLPDSSWKRITFAVLLFLQKAGSGSAGQNMRSKVLRLLAQMFQIRPEGTAFATMRILSAIKVTASRSDSGKSINGAPALLRLMSAAFQNASSSDMDLIFEKHEWVVFFCSRVVQSPECDVRSVELTCDVVNRLLSHIKSQIASEQNTYNGIDGKSTLFSKMLNEVASAMSKLFSRLMSAMDNQRNAQRKWSAAFGRALLIVENILSVSPKIGGSLLELADELGAFLQNPTISISLESTLKTLCAILRTASSTGLQARSVSVSQLLPLLSSRRFIRVEESYTALCDLIATVGSDDLEQISLVLKNFNAMSKSRLGELDLDTRIESLTWVTTLFKNGLGGNNNGPRAKACDLVLDKDGITLSVDSIVALCHGCIASVYVNDTAVRGSAGYALSLISRWCGFSDSNVGQTARYIVYRALFEALITARKISHRREICGAFGEFVRCNDGFENHKVMWEGVSFLEHFKQLCNATDLETDFFENVVHLQAHRRSRALRQLEKHLTNIREGEDCDTNKNLKESLVDFSSVFVLPFSLQMAWERPDMDEQKRKKNQKHFTSREDIQKDVAVWAVGLAGAAASIVDWHDYKRCLDNLLRKVSIKNDDDGEDTNVPYKLLVKVAESFPTSDESRYPDEKIATSYLVDVLFPKMLRHVNVAATSDLLHHREKSGSTFMLAGNRKDKTQNSFRAPVAVALGKLMMHLPEDHLETLMPLLVTPLTSALRSRMISTRDAAKKALTSVTLCLGPKYLHFILDQVLSALGEGFRKDMCIYVLQALLQGIEDFCKGDTRKPFAITDSVDLVIDQIVQELKGGASDTRKDFEDPNASDTRVKQAAARAVKSYECGELLGRLVSFEVSAKGLCEPLLELYSKTASTKLIGRVDQLIQRLLLGFSKNDSMTVEKALLFCHDFVTGNEDNGESDNDDDDDDDVGGEGGNDNINDNEKGNNGNDNEKVGNIDNNVKTKSRVVLLGHSRWVNFGLQLMNSVLAKNGNLLNERGEHTARIFSMCQPFLPLCVAALKTGQDDVTLNSFRVLQRLLKLPVAGKQDIAKEVSKVIVDVLSHHSGGVSGSGDYSSTNELFNTCLRAAAVLLKEVDNFEFSLVSKTRVDALLAVACGCIETGTTLDSRSAAMALLRSVVSKRIVLPCVYDTMQKVNRLAIHAQSAALRAACIQVSVQFVCTFPLGGKRVRQHVEFFVRNVSYEMASGRVAALQAIREMIIRFPDKLIERECEYLFIAVTATIARDSDEDCRVMGSDCVRGLFQRLGGGPSDGTDDSGSLGRKVTELLRIGSRLVGIEGGWTMTVMDEIIACRAMGGTEENEAVRRCGLASLAAGCRSGKLSRLQLKLVLKVVVHVLKQVSTEEENNESDGENKGTGWETWLVGLQCAEAVFEANDEIKGSTNLETESVSSVMWVGVMKKCLLHRHQWVRLLAARLVGRHLSACGGRNWGPSDGKNQNNDTWVIWNQNTEAREWVKACCLQLEADHLSTELGQQCLKNVLCMADVVRLHPMAGDIGKRIANDGEELGEGSDVDGNVEDIENDGDVTGSEEKVGRMLRWVVSRMCGLAVKGGHDERDFLRRGCALRFMLVSVKWWGVDIVGQFLRQYVSPVVKVLESGQTEPVVTERWNKRDGGRDKKGYKRRDYRKNDNEENSQSDEDGNREHAGIAGMRTIADGLQSALIECVGNENYFKLYHEIRSKVTVAKNERKKRAAVMVAIDGERAAKKKRTRHMNKRRGGAQQHRYGDGDTGEIEQGRRAKMMLTDGL